MRKSCRAQPFESDDKGLGMSLQGETFGIVKTAVVKMILVFFVTTENPQTNKPKWGLVVSLPLC